MTDFLYKDLTHKIIGAAFEVRTILGYGFLEKVYENALMVELRLRGIFAEQQIHVDVNYKSECVGEYIPDIVVEKKVIVELKAEKVYDNKHEAQLLNYLKATSYEVGLLLNFGEEKCEFKRMVMSKNR